MSKLSDKDINFITKAMKKCKVEVTPGGKTLEEVKIRRGIFQGDTLSLLRLEYWRKTFNTIKYIKVFVKYAITI